MTIVGAGQADGGGWGLGLEVEAVMFLPILLMAGRWLSRHELRFRAGILVRIPVPSLTNLAT